MKGNALGYLLRTKMRNQLLSFFKKPIRIVYVVIVLGLLAMTFIGGKSGAAEPDRKLRDISELTAGINALFILIFSIVGVILVEAGIYYFTFKEVELSGKALLLALIANLVGFFLGTWIMPIFPK